MIKKITIEIDGKEIELTEVQARQLQGDLDRVFGKPAEYIPAIPIQYPWSTPWTFYGPGTTNDPHNNICTSLNKDALDVSRLVDEHFFKLS